MDLDWPPKILERGLHRCDIYQLRRLESSISQFSDKCEFRPKTYKVLLQLRKLSGAQIS